MTKSPQRGRNAPPTKITDLRAFEAWIIDQGLAATTATTYAYDVRSALVPGFKERLRDEALAPKTRHRILAAGRQWAAFRSDDELKTLLESFRLPPSRRKHPKTPIEREQLFKIIDELPKADYLTPAACAVIGMLACRGFRVSDVLRIRRDELLQAKESGMLVYLAKGRRRIEFGLIKTWSHYAIALADAPGEWERVEDLISRDAKPKTRRKAAVRAIQRSLNIVAGRCGIPRVYPHRLRRTYAVEYLRHQKGDPEALLKLTQHMQWADESTALQYVNHIRGGELDAAAERMFER
jgi:integrase